MPNFRKLDPSEIQTIENKGVGTRKLTEKLYDSILADYEVGEYGEATLDEGENRLTVRNRMKAAATRRGLGINFRRTQGDLLRFQIIEGNSNGTVVGGTLGAGNKVVFRVTKEDVEELAREFKTESSAPESSDAPKRKGGRPKKTPAA